MTPAPPPPSKDDDLDVADILNQGSPEHEGFDPDSLDSDFEQELEDLFADDLEEDSAAAQEAEADEPIMLDDLVEADEEPEMDDEGAAPRHHPAARTP